MLLTFQARAASTFTNVNNYMASVQSLSALTDDYEVTSLPLSAATAAQFRHVSTTVRSDDQSTAVRDQYADCARPNGYRVPVHWQYDRPAHWYCNANRYAGDGYDWCSMPNARYHSQQYRYVNGFGPNTVPSACLPHCSARYHPYAVAGATATGSVGVAASSTSHYDVNQRAPVDGAQLYSHSPGGATRNFSHPVTYGTGQSPYVAYRTQTTDYVNNGYSTPHDHLNHE